MGDVDAHMGAGHSVISQNAIWPGGFRKVLGDGATNLEIDRDLDIFYEDAALVIDDYYND